MRRLYAFDLSFYSPFQTIDLLLVKMKKQGDSPRLESGKQIASCLEKTFSMIRVLCTEMLHDMIKFLIYPLLKYWVAILPDAHFFHKTANFSTDNPCLRGPSFIFIVTVTQIT